MTKGRVSRPAPSPYYTESPVAENSVQQGEAVRQSRRAARWAARHVVRDLLGRKTKMSLREQRARDCGHKCRSSDGITVKVRTGLDGVRSAGYAGLSSCGSVWACPWCSAKIANVRQQEISGAVREWIRRGGRVVMVTTTMRHHRGQRLPMLWDALSGAKHQMLSGWAWQGEQRVFGQLFPRTIQSGRRKGEVVWEVRIPTIGLVEVTHGFESGWHVHLHALLFVSNKVDPAAVDVLAAGMFDRWCRALKSAGLEPSDEFGMEAHLVDGRRAGELLGKYFAKNVYVPADVDDDDSRRIGMEVARGDMKDGRMGNRTPFGILRGLVEVTSTGDLERRTDAAAMEHAKELDRDEELWSEWATDSAGRRQIAWSPGLRQYLARVLPAEQSDAEIADTDMGGDEVAAVPALTWAAIEAARAACRVLATFEVSTAAGVELLDAFAIEGFRRRATRSTRAG